MTEERLKVLALDIETSPNLGYWFGGLYNINIGYTQVKEWSRVICFSAQWEGSKNVIFKSEYHDGPEEMFKTIHKLLDEADVVMHYNGDGFDLPWLDGELSLNGYTEYSPVKSIDLYKHFKKRSRMPSKKLDVVVQRFLGQRKVPHMGFLLWFQCIDSSVDEDTKRKAWNLMRRYAKNDTRLLFPLFEEIKGWIKFPVPMVISDDGQARCQCGSTNIQWRGKSRTGSMSYKRFQCKDCGKWSQSVAPGDKHSNGYSRAI